MVKVGNDFTITVNGTNFYNTYNAIMTDYLPGVRVLRERYIDRDSFSGLIDNCDIVLGRPEFTNRIVYFSFVILGSSGKTHSAIREIHNNHCNIKQTVVVSDNYSVSQCFMNITDVDIRGKYAKFTIVCTAYPAVLQRGTLTFNKNYDVPDDGVNIYIDGANISDEFGVSVISLAPVSYVRKSSDVELVFRDFPQNNYIDSISGNVYINQRINPRDYMQISFDVVYHYDDEYNFGRSITGIEKFVQYINGFVSDIDFSGISLSVKARMKATYSVHTPKYTVVNVIATVANPNNIYNIMSVLVKNFPSSISESTNYIQQDILVSTNSKILVTYTDADTLQQKTVSISGDRNILQGLRPLQDGTFNISFDIDTSGLVGITYGELESYTFGQIGTLHTIGEWESGTHVLPANPYVLVEWRDKG